LFCNAAQFQFDTRKIEPNSLFVVAIKGEQFFDANTFTKEH
jgi:UDP-N-acetylmuramyl pentapeptide synthase